MGTFRFFNPSAGTQSLFFFWHGLYLFMKFRIQADIEEIFSLVVMLRISKLGGHFLVSNFS